jgi:hypothetical protein
MDGDAGRQTDDPKAQSPCAAGVSLMAFVMRASLPPSTTVAVPVLGDVTMAVENRQIRSEQVANLALGCHGIGLSLSGARAVLWIEKGLARLAVDALLGRKPSIAVGGQELSRIERGLLQGVAAGIAMALGLPPAIGLGGVAERSASGPVVVRTRVEIAGTSGHAWVCSTEEFVKQVLRSEMIDPQLVIELSRTVVACADIASASINDAVVFDETSAVAASDRWSVGLRVGNKVARAELLPDGKLTVVESRYAPEETTKIERRHGHSEAERAAGGADGTEIVAEIARLAGAQLADLIDQLALSRSMGVTLTIADLRWAEGNITAIDGCLAVRLTKRPAS